MIFSENSILLNKNYFTRNVSISIKWHGIFKFFFLFLKRKASLVSLDFYDRNLHVANNSIHKQKVWLL